MPNKRDKQNDTSPTTGPSMPAPKMLGESEASPLEADSDADALVARYAEEARAIDARDVTPFKGNTARAVINVQTGVSAVLAESARFAEKGAPAVDLTALEGTVGVAKALDFAARRVRQVGAAPTTKRAVIGRAAKVRGVLAVGARALASAGLLDAAEVKRITGGRGPTHTGQSCCDLAALFRRNEATIRGRHAVTEAQIDEAARLGSMLVATVVPRGGKVPTAADPATAQAAELRDRLGVLLTRRYFVVESVGGWLWGRAVIDHVPALHTFERTTPAAKKVSEEEVEPTDEDGAVDDVTPEGGW